MDLTPVVAWDRSVSMCKVPVTSTRLLSRLKFPSPSASAPGVAKARFVNCATPFRKVTFCALSSEATIGASAAAFSSFFFGPVPLARWLNPLMVCWVWAWVKCRLRRNERIDSEGGSPGNGWTVMCEHAHKVLDAAARNGKCEPPALLSIDLTANVDPCVACSRLDIL